MATSDTFEKIYELLKACPGLSGAIGIENAMSFIRLATRLKEEILFKQPPGHDPSEPPDELPQNVKDFIGSAAKIPDAYVQGCWDVFRGTIWQRDKDGDSLGEDTTLFRKYGLKNLLSTRTLFPPTRTCINPDCPKRHTAPLLRRKDDPSQVTLFTLGEGACPTYSVHLYCYGCNINYHHDHYVQGDMRTYYEGVPDVVEVCKHQFVEREVLSLFTGLMLLSWTSATNGARVYNECLSKPENQTDDWKFDAELRTEHVWDGFCLLSLLEDHARSGSLLSVPNGGLQKDRFTEAMQARNLRIQAAGQKEYAHCCNKCIRVWPAEDGKPQQKCSVLVIDGITIGHPCCGILHCSTPLANQRHRYCPGHDGYHYICAVEGCTEAVATHDPGEPARMTCDYMNHAALEKRHKQRGTAFFQLRGKLQRATVAHPVDSDAAQPTVEEVEELELDDDKNGGSACLNKPDTGNRKITALFGRRRTHNEQIMVRPCGIIVARQTFYGSEMTPQTVDMIHKVFQVEGSMPNIIFYDNNCGLYRHLVAVGDDLYQTVGLPVDVFHWECKHKKSDVECSVHCNPHNFPELVGEDGKTWAFNSSIAEQTNVWFGGYHAMLRQMGMVKFNFFLDEMIMCKNRMVKAKLEEDGAFPHYIKGLHFGLSV